MKIIVSHDVDHINSYEHFRDLIVPKYVARAALELAKGQISPAEFALRMGHVITGRWNCVRELADFDSKRGIQSTFFFAAANGIGLMYSTNSAKPFVDYVVASAHKIGIHGVARREVGGIRDERSEFERAYRRPCIGIRLHYLGTDKAILRRLAEAGYAYDSSLRGDDNAYPVGEMLHFPVHVMDGDMILMGKRHQSVSLKQAVDATIEKICRCADNQVDFFSLLFHDRYFNAAHVTWQDWYVEVIDWLIAQKFEFCSYEDASLQLRNCRNY